MSLIKIEDLTFSYTSQQNDPALKNLSCTIEQGSFVGITGLAEAGKSTFCRLMAGYIPHFFHGEFSGKVTVAGTDTRERTIGELAEKVGFVFENPFDQLTGASLTVLEEAALRGRVLVRGKDTREYVGRRTHQRSGAGLPEPGRSALQEHGGGRGALWTGQRGRESR